ncbi:hypothetical protein F5Y04DRAFT_153650 [Hypomontagnella monticulosa]|nr:hypothetical protein F5Y04DRAFT_153650 [Hypomontagnella monticulosa]
MCFCHVTLIWLQVADGASGVPISPISVPEALNRFITMFQSRSTIHLMSLPPLLSTLNQSLIQLNTDTGLWLV